MKPYTHLLAAIDFTPHSREAFREAVRLAHTFGAKLIAVHILDEYLVHELMKALSLDQASLLAEWTQRLRRFVDETEVGTALVEVEALAGHPYTGLVEAAERHHADLLVMGMQGSVEQRGRVGAIAAKCVRKAPLDVLLVRADCRGPFQRVVTSTDFSPSAMHAMERAAQIAALDAAALDCVHVHQSVNALVLDYGSLAVPSPYVLDPASGEHWKNQLSEAAASLQASQPKAKVSSVFLEGLGIREGIIEHALKSSAGLVVVSTRGKTGLREMLIGTTAEAVISHAPCSILAVKPESMPTTSA
jgi:universal stress protein E